MEMEAPQRQAEHMASEKLKCKWMTRREMDGESEEMGGSGEIGRERGFRLLRNTALSEDSTPGRQSLLLLVLMTGFPFPTSKPPLSFLQSY